MNWKIFVARHWKAIMIVSLIGMFALSIVVTKARAEPIDTPCGP